jgi:hypothetical protein
MIVVDAETQAQMLKAATLLDLMSRLMRVIARKYPETLNDPEVEHLLETILAELAT